MIWGFLITLLLVAVSVSLYFIVKSRERAILEKESLEEARKIEDKADAKREEIMVDTDRQRNDARQFMRDFLQASKGRGSKGS